MLPETLALIREGDAKKGDVIGTARLAGIMAAKRTHELIPLCHPAPLQGAGGVRGGCRPAGPSDHGGGARPGADRRGDGGVDRRLARLPHCLRHGEGRGSGHAHRGESGCSPRMAVAPAPTGRTRLGRGDAMSGLISVAEALSRILASVTEPVSSESAPLARAAGRGVWRRPSPRRAPSRRSAPPPWMAMPFAPPMRGRWAPRCGSSDERGGPRLHRPGRAGRSGPNSPAPRCPRGPMRS